MFKIILLSMPVWSIVIEPATFSILFACSVSIVNQYCSWIGLSIFSKKKKIVKKFSSTDRWSHTHTHMINTLKMRNGIPFLSIFQVFSRWNLALMQFFRNQKRKKIKPVNSNVKSGIEWIKKKNETVCWIPLNLNHNSSL